MYTLTAPFFSVTEIKKSRFITHASPVTSKEEALAFLETVRDPCATHNCWAYRIGSEYRFNDDGEPGGTAGKPILTAIEGAGIDGVMVVVIRFFGGIKLGAGGLVRAYGNAAATCLGHAQKQEIIPTEELRFEIPFDSIGCVYPLLEKHQAKKHSEQYLEACVAFNICLPAKIIRDFELDLIDATSGKAIVKKVVKPH